MEYSKKESYAHQVGLYLKNKEDQKAYDLSKEYTGKYKQDMLAHYLLAQSAMNIGKPEECKLEALKAYGLAKSRDDMERCLLLASTAFYSLKEYAKGEKMLKQFAGTSQDERIEEALFIFAYAQMDKQGMIDHIGKLMKLNQQAGLELIKKTIGI